MTSTTPYSQGLQTSLYRHSRRRLGGPWVGPINAALKRLKLATVTPDAISTLSTSSASLVFCRFSGAFSSSLTHATINLQPPSHTVLYQTPGSSAALLQSPAMPNNRRSSAPDPCFPAFSSSPHMPAVTFQHAHFIPIVGVGKERRTSIGPW